MIFERRLEDHLIELRDDLVSGMYRHGPYEPFVIYDPKQRTIHKASVRDRIVHQAIVNVIEPCFERRFIHDSFSCRVGKGTHAAVRRLNGFLRSFSQNDTRTIYALKCDVRKFFASVDQDVLFQRLTARIKESKIIELLRGIIGSFSTSPGKGIPLGNLTSQLFANVYLHELDWYVKQTLHIQHYVRYCDDFVLLTESPEVAAALTDQIDTFLNRTLKLTLHPDKVLVRTWKQGIDFLGYVLLPHATILRPETARRAVREVTQTNIASYLGMCTHANTYNIERILLNKSPPA